MDPRFALWRGFCSEHRIYETAVPLFDTRGDKVNLTVTKNTGRKMLARSVEMTEMVIREVNKVTDDHKSGTDQFQGLLYMMLWKCDDMVTPLYIGKAEKHGLKGSNLSANIKSIQSNNGKFARWGYSSAYHLGRLSTATLTGGRGPADKVKANYEKWAQRLFTAVPTDVPELFQPTYFWMTAWRRGCIGPWEEFGATTLPFAEHLLIGLASELFPDDLLNEEGVIRR